MRLLAKLEGNNPTGSVKDRVAWAMLSDARASGALRPGQTILEPSSGNTGISLAMLGVRLGHPVRIVMPDNTTREREQLLRLYGAEIVYSPGDEGSNGAIRMAEELAAADPSLFMPYQYGNPANPRVHETSTGPEILAQAGDVDAFVAGLGTGGTLTGVGRFLKRARPGVRVVAAEPLPGELVQGLRSLDEGFVPPVFDPSVLDDRLLVTNARRGHRSPAAAARGGDLRRALIGGGDRRCAQGRAPDGSRHGGRAAGRRRLEVPLRRPLDA